MNFYQVHQKHINIVVIFFISLDEMDNTLQS